MKNVVLILLALCTIFPFVSCGKGNDGGSYEQITPAEAKVLMDSEKDYIILDVRTEEEFAAGHIEGAVLIPDYDIDKKAESVLKDKGQLILVYCRSGRRSKNAASKLVTLGYTNVKEFGGIIDWTYGVVS